MITTLTGVSYFNPVIDVAPLSEKNKVSSIEHTGPGSSSIEHTTLSANSNTSAHLESKGKLSGKLKGMNGLEAVEGEDTYVFIRHTNPEGAKGEKEEDQPNDEDTQVRQHEKHEGQNEGKAGDVKKHAEK